jgi:pimeloyl-ACP methyl ester carboxylesterase
VAISPAGWRSDIQPSQVSQFDHDTLRCETGNRGPQALLRTSPASSRTYAGQDPAGDRKAAVTAYVEAWRSYQGPRFPFDETWIRRCAEYSYDRSYDPSGVARQFTAIIHSPDLLDAQEGITCPTVVIQGDADPLVGVDHAREIASRISGARLKLIAGLGHEMRRQAWPELFGAILDAVRLSGRGNPS